MGCHALLRSLQPRGSNPGLLHCKWIFYHLSHQEVIPWCIRVKNTGVVSACKCRRLGGSMPWSESLESGYVLHSNILLWIEELGRLQSVGSQRNADSTQQCQFTFIYHISIYIFIYIQDHLIFGNIKFLVILTHLNKVIYSGQLYLLPTIYSLNIVQLDINCMPISSLSNALSFNFQVYDL